MKQKSKKNVDLQIDPQVVEEKYNLPKNTAPKKNVSSTDALSKLLNISLKKEYGTFIDDNKRTRKIIISCPEEFKCTLSSKTDIPCYWDSHKFNTLPIGCPLKIEVDKEGKTYYVTDGIFCSFPCCYSFIREKLRSKGESHTYRESLNLLNQLYFDVFGSYPGKGGITEAPHWRLIFNKNMTIDEFRDSLQSSHIISTNNISFPICKSVSMKFEEIVKF
jgi:hypothetical protein